MDQNKRMPGSEQTKGTGSDSTRNRSSESDTSSGSDSSRSGSSDSSRSSDSSSDSVSSRETGGGITNRSMEEELSEQEELPERGSRQSER